MADFKEALEASAKSYFVCAAHAASGLPNACARDPCARVPASLFRSGK